MVFVLAAALALAAPGGAQAPAPPAGKKAPEAPAVNPDLPVPPANYEYAGGGRRDPFISLVNRGVDPRGGEPAFRAEGVPGLMTSEITVRGILQSRGEWVAMVSGVDGKVYTIRAGAKLADGVVREVTAQAVVILQDVNDPLSLDKQREVRKFLRGGEEVK
jgi:Tfp pilus assembly protein PilP